jgi:glycolate oxidase FAD binding subunit
VLADARETAARHDVPIALRGSAGAGVLYGALPASCDPAVVAEVVGVLRATCAAYGGSVVVVDAPAGIKESVDVWGPVPATDLMRRVKDQFDPGHRLSPGRFVGGI